LSTKIVIFSYPKLLSFFRTDLHKMKINTELCCKRYDFLTKKTQNYRYQNDCPGRQEFKSIHMAFYVNPSWACTLFRNNKQCGSWAKEKVSMRGRKRTLTDSERKMNRSEVSSKWNKCRIYVGDQLDRWNELKEVLRVQTRAEVAKILLDR
jgi:hypothetical protein